MASNYYYPTSKNAIQKTLAAQLLSTASTGDAITFDDVDGVQNKPGVLVINRVDSNGTATPSSREFISFTGTSGNTVLIETRNVDSSGAARTHAVGSIVEFISDGVWGQRIIDQALVEHGVDGTHSDITATTVTTTGLVDANTLSIAAGTAITAFHDDDALSNASATSVASDESIKAYADSVTVADSDGATITFDLGSGAYRKHAVTLGGNRTLALSNALTGMAFIISLTQDGTGSRTVTWFSTIKWAGGSAPTLTTTASKRDVFGFICTGTDTYDGFVVGSNI